MATIQEKIDTLRQELGEVVEQHNQAVQIQTAAKEKAISIQGAIEALKELLDGEEAPAEAG
jgi:small-conductance mechanosensitive channel